MRLLKTHSHTSERLRRLWRQEKREEKKLKENAGTIIKQTTIKKLPRTASVAGGREEEGRYCYDNSPTKDTMTRQTTVKNLPRTASVVGGKTRPDEECDWRETRALWQGKPTPKPSRGPPLWRGARRKGENQHEKEMWHNPQPARGGSA